MDVADVLKTPKFEGFDRESRSRPFLTMFPCSDCFCFFVEQTLWIAITCYGINFKITNLDLF